MNLRLVSLFFLIQMIGYESKSEMEWTQHLLEHMKKTSYQKSVKPTGNFSNMSNSHQVIEVKVRLYINEFGEISETKNDFTTSVTLIKQWTDQRLRLNGSFDFLSLAYFHSNIWTPDIYFYNMKTLLSSQENPSLIFLYPNGTITYSTTLRMKLYCNMILWRFPLDSQTCYMNLGSYCYSAKDLILKWWNVDSETKENVKLKYIINSDFHIPRINISSDDHFETHNGLFSILTVTFSFERNFMYHLIYTFLPTTLIVSVSWVSFLIDYKAAPARVPFCLLTLISIMTQWSSINALLPRLPYLKCVDVWMFICLLFIIFSLFEYALVNRIAVRQEKYNISRKDDEKTKNNSSKTEQSHKIFTINLNKKPEHDDSPSNLTLKKETGNTTRCHCVKACLLPGDIDRIARYIFPLMFINVNIIFWGIIYLYK